MAQFRTARFQEMIPVDVVVVGAVTEGTVVTSANRRTAILRGDLVQYVPATTYAWPYIIKVEVGDEDKATHIVASTDQTLSDGHIATDLKDYRASDLVGATVDAAANIAATTRVKKVGLYPILDWNDVILDTDGLDRLASST